ncbi:MFS transporter, partial [Kibdelosporangium lantanae]
PAAASPAAGVRIPGMADQVRTAFLSGMADMLWVCVGFGVLGGVLTLAFLPRRPQDVENHDEYAIAA